MTVYVLETESVDNSNYSHDIRVYANIEDAQKTMNEQFDVEQEYWYNSYEQDKIETYNNRMLTAYIQEKGYYDNHHISWNIYKREVIK